MQVKVEQVCGTLPLSESHDSLNEQLNLFYINIESKKGEVDWPRVSLDLRRSLEALIL